MLDQIPMSANETNLDTNTQQSEYQIQSRLNVILRYLLNKKIYLHVCNLFGQYHSRVNSRNSHSLCLYRKHPCFLHCDKLKKQKPRRVGQLSVSVRGIIIAEDDELSLIVMGTSVAKMFLPVQSTYGICHR